VVEHQHQVLLQLAQEGHLVYDLPTGIMERRPRFAFVLGSVAAKAGTDGFAGRIPHCSRAFFSHSGVGVVRVLLSWSPHCHC